MMPSGLLAFDFMNFRRDFCATNFGCLKSEQSSGCHCEERSDEAICCSSGEWQIASSPAVSLRSRLRLLAMTFWRERQYTNYHSAEVLALWLRLRRAISSVAESLPIFLLALLASCLFSVSPALAQSDDLAKARVFVEIGDYENGIELLKPFLLANPKDAEARYLYAKCLFNWRDTQGTTASGEEPNELRGLAQLQVLSRLGDEGFAWLTKAVQDDNEKMRRAARTYASQSGDKQAAVTLLTQQLSMSSWSENELAQIIESLGLIGDSSAIPKLRPFLTHQSLSVRLAAATALGKLADRDSWPVLTKLYLQANRGGAIDQLGHQEWTVSALIGLLKDPQRKLRDNAMNSLLRLGTQQPSLLKTDEAVDSLLAAVTDPSSEFRDSAVTLLGLVGDARAVETLIALAEKGQFSGTETDGQSKRRGPSGRIGEKAASALKSIGDQKAAQHFIEMAQSGDPGKLKRAVDVLEILEDPASVAPLEKILSSTQDAALQRQIASLLTRLTGREYQTDPDSGAELVKRDYYSLEPVIVPLKDRNQPDHVAYLTLGVAFELADSSARKEIDSKKTEIARLVQEVVASNYYGPSGDPEPQAKLQQQLQSAINESIGGNKVSAVTFRDFSVYPAKR